MPCFLENEIWMCFSEDADIKKCQHCGKIADYLCDWPVGNGKTCDLPLCEDHAFIVNAEEDIHFCPVHASMYKPERKFDIMPGKIKIATS